VSGTNLVLSVSGITAGADYFVRVASAGGAAANYDIAVGFRATRPEGHGSYGTLSQAVTGTTATLNIYQTQVVRISLTNAGPVGSDAQVWVRIYDSQNRLVCQLALGPGQAASRTLLLKRGQYRLEVGVTGTSLPDVPYWFQICGLTDPEGISGTDTVGVPVPTTDPLGGATTAPDGTTLTVSWPPTPTPGITIF
jgi:hypothetical protein